MDVCTSQNKSLPGIDSGFLTSPVDRDNKSLICLAVHQNSSIMFRPVIKQVVANTDGNTTFEPINNTRGLPFLCRVKTGKVRLLKNAWFYECNENCETSIKIMHCSSVCFFVIQAIFDRLLI